MEPNPKLRELAANRVASVPGAGFVDGLAADLPVADGSVDLLWCERVLQHLADPQAAIMSSGRPAVTRVPWWESRTTARRSATRSPTRGPPG